MKKKFLLAPLYSTMIVACGNQDNNKDPGKKYSLKADNFLNTDPRAVSFFKNNNDHDLLKLIKKELIKKIKEYDLSDDRSTDVMQKLFYFITYDFDGKYSKLTTKDIARKMEQYPVFNDVYEKVCQIILHTRQKDILLNKIFIIAFTIAENSNFQPQCIDTDLAEKIKTMDIDNEMSNQEIIDVVKKFFSSTN